MRDDQPTRLVETAVADWYKDAIIYQLHVKAFHDGDADGVGDFAGLIEKLDYIEELGVDCVWLLPFYPSPLRDDGYDIADYESVHPAYGDIDSFRRFVAEAHRRGIRVVTELVINHTSDQHPWFQRARRAPPGSPERDFYVWSDTDAKFPETRIIFIDSEKSNWSWDPVAGAYFWHRFYHHQPDLNFDNPAVMQEVLRVMRYWLEMGVDGLRLDAIPYLVEREGTNNENLPETHEVLKRIRAELDAHFEGRMLLAEANQWPEDTRPYFGEGDECHMGFHFPLMPRMYMALAQEDRYPITDILRQTPEIPESCQWAIFLRNHDELTLEMVTERERDYLWSTYAKEQRARINLGIRRRLAPLLDNDRRKIELMNALLFSMPGTPVIYYGDEIGMGDNFYLGDRDGVRTPMQWSPDRNGGFSRAKPQQLYLPAIQDPVYGFEAVNVEAQSGSPGSLLHWMRRTIRIRKRMKAFGRGALEFLYPRNRKVLAYIRRHEDETVLCVFNVSRSAQAAELDLSAYRGCSLVELEGGSVFPPAGDLPYLLTLPPYGYFWLQLTEHAAAPDWHAPVTGIQPEFATIACRGESIAAALSSDALARLEREALPEFLPLQRWFAGHGETMTGLVAHPGPEIGPGVNLTVVEVETAESGPRRHLLPLATLWGEEHLQFGAPTLSATVSRLRRANRLGALIDAVADPRFVTALLALMRDGGRASAGGVTLSGDGAAALAALGAAEHVRAVGNERSSDSFSVEDAVIVRVYRKLEVGHVAEVEIARFLTEHAGFDRTPALLGEVSLALEDGAPMTAAACFEFVRNQGDAGATLVDALLRELEDRADVDGHGQIETAAECGFPYPLDITEVIGRRLGELHMALTAPTDDLAFGVSPVMQGDLAVWAARARMRLDEAFRALESLPRDAEATALFERRGEAESLLDSLARAHPSGGRSRVHGDFRLNRVLIASDDVWIIGFEGDPEDGPLRTSPMRDVAAMRASLEDAACAAVRRLRERNIHDAAVEAVAWAWRDRAVARFETAYAAATETLPTAPDDRAQLTIFALEEAFGRVADAIERGPEALELAIAFALSTLDEARR